MLNEAVREKIFRACLFLFSAGLHVVLFSVLLDMRYTIKIYENQSDIREVVIVPEDRLIIPWDIETASGDIPEDVLIVGRKRAQAGQTLSPVDQPSIGSRGSGRPKAAAPSMEGTVPVPEVRFQSSSSFRFNLDWSTRLKSEEESYFDLALNPPKGEETPDSGRSPGGGKAGDLRRYIRRGAQPISGSIPKSATRAAFAAVPVSTYDLSPWADKVIALIQNLWRLDAAQNGEPRGRLEVRIAVGRDGSLKTIDIIRSSDDEGLDRAAVRAVESNLPFPPLPDDFPLERLEFTLVFEYDY